MSNMKIICFEETDESEVISYPTDNYIDAFNFIKTECENTDLIMVKQKDVMIFDPLDQYYSKMLNSECQIGGTELSIDGKFDLYENDFIETNLTYINCNMFLVNCSEFIKLETLETDMLTTGFDIYGQLSLYLSLLTTKYYIFPKLYLDSLGLPHTLYPEECHSAKLEDISNPNWEYASDIFLWKKYSSNELEEKYHIIPLDIRIQELKKKIIIESVVDQEWQITRSSV